jgi:methyl-accepting chemotaxis protein
LKGATYNSSFEEIGSSFIRITNITDHTLYQTQQVSASAEEINVSAASLAELAEELQSLVHKFKI